MKLKQKKFSGSTRDKSGPTKKYNKFKDPFYFCAHMFRQQRAYRHVDWFGEKVRKGVI